MEIVRCSQCDKHFFRHHRRCTHCRTLRQDVNNTHPLNKPVPVLASLVVGATLMIVWGLADQKSLYAADDNPGPKVEISRPQP